jgi:hypothetical protein
VHVCLVAIYVHAKPEKFRRSRDTTGIEISPKHEAADYAYIISVQKF